MHREGFRCWNGCWPILKLGLEGDDPVLNVGKRVGLEVQCPVGGQQVGRCWRHDRDESRRLNLDNRIDSIAAVARRSQRDFLVIGCGRESAGHEKTAHGGDRGISNSVWECQGRNRARRDHNDFKVHDALWGRLLRRRVRS